MSSPEELRQEQFGEWFVRMGMRMAEQTKAMCPALICKLSEVIVVPTEPMKMGKTNIVSFKNVAFALYCKLGEHDCPLSPNTSPGEFNRCMTEAAQQAMDEMGIPTTIRNSGSTGIIRDN